MKISGKKRESYLGIFVFTLLFITFSNTVWADTYLSNLSGGSGAWNSAGSWTGGSGSFPTSSDSAVIQNGDVISLDTDRNVDGINIDDGELDCNGFTLSINGDLVVGSNGTWTVGGDANFVGSGSQNITFNGSGRFGNLTMNKTTGSLVTTSNFDIDNVLLLDNGTFTISNGNIINLNGSGTIVDIEGGGFSTSSSGQLNFDDDATISYTSGATNLPGLKLVRTIAKELTLSGDIEFTVYGDIERGGRHSLSLDGTTDISYNPGLTLKYSATTSSMTVGSEWPAPTGGPTNITILSANSVNVILNSSRDISGILTLEQSNGDFVVSGASTVLDIGGILERKTSGTRGISTTGSGSVTYTGSGTLLRYNTSANTTVGEEWPSTVSVAPQNVEVIVAGGNALQGSNISRTVAVDLTLSVGTINFGNGTLTVLGNITTSEISGNATLADATALVIGNGTDGASNPQSVTGALALNKLTIDKRSGTSPPNDNTVTVSGTFNFSANGTLTVSNGILTLSGPGKLSGSNLGTLSLTISSGGILKTGGTSLTSISGTINVSNGTVVFSGTSGQETMPAWTIANLEIDNNSGTTTSSGTLTVGNLLTFTNGMITTSSSNILRLDSDATISGAGSSDPTTHYVAGPLQKELSGSLPVSFVFPIGTTERRSATFQYTTSTVFNGTSIIEIKHSTDSFTPKSPPSGINSIDQSSHYIVRERGSSPSTIDYNFTGTFEDGNFNPETKNRALVESSTTYILATSNSVNTSNNTVQSGTFSVMPVGSYRIVFGDDNQNIKIWSGGASGSWSSASNWTPNGTPNQTHYVTIGGNVTVNISPQAANCATLTIGDGANQATLNVANTLTVYDNSSDAITVRNNSILIEAGGDQITFNAVGGSYDESLTNYRLGSIVEYQTGASVQVDEYHNLIINGASATAGSGTITVNGNLDKQSATAFSTSQNVTITSEGSYTNTAGSANYNGGLTMNGTPFTVNGGSAIGTVTFSGSSEQIINGSITVALSSLTINNSSISGVHIATGASASVSGSGTLTLTDGILFTSSSASLTLLSGAGISGGSDDSFVDGPLIIDGTGTKVFPIGNGSTYRPVRVTGTTNSTTFQVFNIYPNGSMDGTLQRISSVRYWLGSGGISGGTVELAFGSDDGVNTSDTTGLRVASSSSVGGPYTSKGNGGSTFFTDAVVSHGTNFPINTLEYFTLGSTTTDHSLPVSLSSFEAQSNSKQVILSWVTQSELNNEGFNIYRKEADMETEWLRINPALIPGQGNTAIETHYEFIDKNAVAGVTYQYKLESVSYSGHRVDEKIVEVSVPLPNQYAMLGNYPNPFNPTTQLRFQLPEQQQVTIYIYDTMGHLVKKLLSNELFAQGEHSITWDATDAIGRNVASGMYIFRFSAGNYVKSGKMLLLK